MPHELRPYQRQIVEDARASFRAGHRSILIVLPTGGGKTRVGAEFVLGAVAKGKKVLWLAHRKELIAQAFERLVGDGVGDCGVISAQLPALANAGAPVQVASLQTLTARDLLPPADLVVFDEAHHYVAAEWHTFAKQYGAATCLGLTATPQRSDKTGLGALFTELIAGPSIKELTALGFLVKCEVRAPTEFLRKNIAQTPAEAWVEAGKPKSVVFCRCVAHSAEVLQGFVAAGARVADVDGNTPNEERTAILRRFQDGALDVIVNVFVLTEGWDCPSAQACILARPTKSISVFLQMVGRVLRPAPGKDKAILIDLPGCIHLEEIGMPDDEREYDLEGEGIKKGIKKSAIRQCLACGLMSRAGAENCVHCGAPWPVDPRLVPAVSDRDLYVYGAGKEYEKEARANVQREFLARGLAMAQEYGYKKSWAAHKFKDRFGYFPWQCGNDVGWHKLQNQPYKTK